MAAWKHFAYWDIDKYRQYRSYVEAKALRYKGRTEDCADISILLLIDFASEQGLPLTFWDNNQVRYPSKGTRQTPMPLLRGKTWSDKKAYVEAVTKRIGSKSLVDHNTVKNPLGPQPGDLMVKADHTALVFGVLKNGATHPKAYDRTIPLFPGGVIAQTQLNQLEYVRSRVSQDHRGCPQTYIDYLNHRGEGNKQRAELIYYADTSEAELRPFEFRMYKPGVIDNWIDWNGSDDPPR
jgi:hypothetical protein